MYKLTTNYFNNFKFTWTTAILLIASFCALVSTYFSFINGTIIAYGDAESHLNISKRVVDSLTPGFSQLGGIWLPIPHLLMVPFVSYDPLWRTGLAGSLISGISYIIAGLFLYKLILLITNNKHASFFGFLVFALNPNILYMQTTPMTEIPLIMFFILSTYFFIKFLKNNNLFLNLIFAAFFGFCATLSRYDGWFLIAIEGAILGFLFIIKLKERPQWFGRIILFSTLAFFGIFLWLLWDYLILGDPLYFSNSPFSAKSQQQGWLARGELPTYHNIGLSFLYYLVTSINNIGLFIAGTSMFGLVTYLLFTKGWNKLFIPLLFLIPFIFYVITLYMGQSVIFTPELVPENFEWNLFNVRYGIMMVPFSAFFIGYLYSLRYKTVKILLIGVLLIQSIFFITGKADIVTLADGTRGLSGTKLPDAQNWITKNYDNGLVLMDDFARTFSVVRSTIPMQQIIYIGNKPYWEESLIEPERYAKWVVMQENDTIWTEINNRPERRDRLYKYFQRVYTSPNILIFKRNELVTSPRDIRYTLNQEE